MSSAVSSKNAEPEPSTSGGSSRGPRCNMPSATSSLDALWVRLHPALVSELHMQQMSKREYIGLYSQVYAYLTAFDSLDGPSVPSASSRQVALFAKVRGVLTEHFDEILQQISAHQGDALLQHYYAGWKDFRISSQRISGICEYMDRFHLKYEMEQTSDQLTVYGTCLLHWKDQLLKPLEAQVIRAVLDMYAADRNGQVINGQLLREMIDNFVELDIATRPNDRDTSLKLYQTVFEEKFLEETKTYYVSESSLFLQGNSASDYIKKVRTRLTEEKDRATKYLHESTLPALFKVLEEALIIPHHNILDKKEFADFFPPEKVEADA